LNSMKILLQEKFEKLEGMERAEKERVYATKEQKAAVFAALQPKLEELAKEYDDSKQKRLYADSNLDGVMFHVSNIYEFILQSRKYELSVANFKGEPLYETYLESGLCLNCDHYPKKEMITEEQKRELIEGHFTEQNLTAIFWILVGEYSTEVYTRTLYNPNF